MICGGEDSSVRFDSKTALSYLPSYYEVWFKLVDEKYEPVVLETTDEFVSSESIVLEKPNGETGRLKSREEEGMYVVDGPRFGYYRLTIDLPEYEPKEVVFRVFQGASYFDDDAFFGAQNGCLPFIKEPVTRARYSMDPSIESIPLKRREPKCLECER